MDWSNLSRSSIKDLQDRLLRQQLMNARFQPFYKETFEKLNLKIDSIRTTDDLVKLPFTYKEDVAPTSEDPAKPRKFIIQPTESELRQYYPKLKLLKYALSGKAKEMLEWEYRPIHIHFTTGRTSAPTPFLHTARDIESIEEAGKRMFEVFGIQKEAKVVNAFPYAPHLAFWQAAYGAKAAGVLALNTGGGKVMGTEKIISSIQAMKAEVLISMPGYAYHLLRTANESGKSMNSLQLIVLGGERIPQGLRDKLRDLSGNPNMRVLGTYAFTEGKLAWPECIEGNGYHTYPDKGFIEIIDPKTGERVPEGQQGEIVYTPLDTRGTAVYRYRTGDLASMSYGQCSCGRSTPKISADIQRKSEFKEMFLTKVKGNLVNLNALFTIFSANKDVAEWQAEIRKKRNDPYEIDIFTVYVAPKKGSDWKKIKADLERQLFAEMEITADVVKKDLKELVKSLGMESELKEKRILDNRPKK